MKRIAIVVVVVFAAVSVMADAGAYLRRDAWGEKTYPAAPHVVENFEFEPAVTLSAEGALDQLEAIREWNAAGKLPARGGFERPIPDVMSVMVRPGVASKGLTASGRGVIAATESGTTVWGTSIRVLGAARLRIRLDDVKVPAGTVMWVYGNSGKPIGFDSDLIDVNGGIWTPSVSGDTVHLEMELPARSDEPASFSIRRVIQLLPLASASMVGQTNDDASCLVDANCINSGTFSQIEIVRHAIAHMEIPVGGGFVGLCTGGLLGDTKQSGTPYFLTASHCFGDDQNPANHPDQVQGMEIYFEYRTSGCNSPNATFLTATIGARLLASSTANDYAFFQLNSIPSGRGFLGWTASPVAAGTPLFRVSHPAPAALQGDPQPQVFTQTVATNSGSTCSSAPRGTYIYENLTSGATYGGSSGAPVMNASAQVVGQLYGKCGPTPNDGCDKANNTIDGAFAPVFESVYKQYLTGSGTGPGPSVCTPSSTTICLSGGRFAVSVQFRNNGQLQNATGIKYTDGSGLFWFFGADNIEILMKVLNACGLNNRIWVFTAATTNVEYHLKVIDTKNGTTKTYDNVAGPPAPAITDTGAFATCP
jgi:hypothetical protein